MMTLKSTNMEDLLRDGFTKKYAKFYLDILEEEKINPVFADKEYVEWAHSHGFTAEFAYVLGINEDNYSNYLSQYDFYKVWPLNNWARIWVNDKLTLKYTLSKLDLEKYMPNYYYYTRGKELLPLMDNNNSNSKEGFLKTLKEVGDLACKPCNGTQSAGFFKLSYINGSFSINDSPVSEDDIFDFVLNHPNYLFTEYLKPSKEWAVYSDTIHTVRIMIINEHGNDPRFVGNYIRIPHKSEYAANYIMHDGTNNEEYNLYVSINMETGEYGEALAIYPERAVKIDKHPDTGAVLSGKISCFEELREASLKIASWYSNLEFIGFDFGITESGIKIMEINTHPAVMVSQIKEPMYLNENTRKYFEKKIAEIDNLTIEEKKRRNDIPR